MDLFISQYSKSLMDKTNDELTITTVSNLNTSEYLPTVKKKKGNYFYFY